MKPLFCPLSPRRLGIPTQTRGRLQCRPSTASLNRQSGKERTLQSVKQDAMPFWTYAVSEKFLFTFATSVSHHNLYSAYGGSVCLVCYFRAAHRLPQSRQSKRSEEATPIAAPTPLRSTGRRASSSKSSDRTCGPQRCANGTPAMRGPSGIKTLYDCHLVPACGYVQTTRRPRDNTRKKTTVLVATRRRQNRHRPRFRTFPNRRHPLLRGYRW